PPTTLSRRALLARAGAIAGVATTFGLMAACQAPTAPTTAATQAPAAAPTQAPAAAKQPTTLTIGSDVDLDNLDPQQAQSAGSEVPSALVFRRLAEYTPTMDADKTGVAESWQQKDPTTYVYTLRQGVKFHTGREMTADDVEFTWKRGFEIGPKGRF